MWWTSRSTSAWESNRGGFMRSAGNGTLVAGLVTSL
jgi:hypothetical protein